MALGNQLCTTTLALLAAVAQEACSKTSWLGNTASTIRWLSVLVVLVRPPRRVVLAPMVLTARLQQSPQLAVVGAEASTALLAMVVLVAAPVMRLVLVLALLGKVMTVALTALTFVLVVVAVLALLVEMPKRHAQATAVWVALA